MVSRKWGFEELDIDTPHRFALTTNPPKGRISNVG
jgi:hypothetical protein